LLHRGHRESSDKPESGNLHSVIQLIEKYDAVTVYLFERKTVLALAEVMSIIAGK
jgi:hypothetical protein